MPARRLQCLLLVLPSRAVIRWLPVVLKRFGLTRWIIRSASRRLGGFPTMPSGGSWRPSSREVGIAQSVQAALEPLFAKGFAARCQARRASQCLYRSSVLGASPNRSA